MNVCMRERIQVMAWQMISHSTNKEGHNFHTEAKHRDKGKKRGGPPLLFLEFGIGIDISHTMPLRQRA